MKKQVNLRRIIVALVMFGVIVEGILVVRHQIDNRKRSRDDSAKVCEQRFRPRLWVAGNPL